MRSLQQAFNHIRPSRQEGPTGKGTRMFRLHDSTRRQICVALFMGLCVLPTLAMGGGPSHGACRGTARPKRPGLARELGVAVSMESVAHTLPGVVRYTGLKLTDPETGRELLRCGEVEATWTSMTDSQGREAPGDCTCGSARRIVGILLAAPERNSPPHPGMSDWAAGSRSPHDGRCLDAARGQ